MNPSARRACLMAALSCALGVAAAAPPRGVQGIVTRVSDGDSLWLRSGNKAPIEVRLRDIDAPESCQPWGPQAREALAELALNKVATLHISGRDSYGRTLGTLMINELNVGRFLVENGHAWSLRTRWDQGPLVKQEKMARALARGLHATAGAVQPRDFRRLQGPCELPEGAAPAQPAPPAASAVSVAPRKPAQAALAQSGWHCDGRSHCAQMTSCEEAKYFLAHCPNVKMDGDRNGVPCERQWCSR